MKINTRNLVSITEANQNFSRVAKLVDKNGIAVVLKNNSPKYVILDYSILESDSCANDEDVKNIGSNIIQRYMHAFQELAK